MKAILITLLDLMPGSVFLYHFKHHGKDRYEPSVVTRETLFVLDGYPRCANTYTYYYLQIAFGEARIAHHIHSWQQFLIGAILRKPCIRLIRRPDDAVASIHTKQMRGVALAYLQYTIFNTLTNRLPSHTVTFEDVTAPGGLQNLAELISAITGCHPNLVDMATVKTLLEERTNARNRRTVPLETNTTGYPTRVFRRLAARAYERALLKGQVLS